MGDLGDDFSADEDKRQPASSAKAPVVPEFPLPSPVTEVKDWGNKTIAVFQAHGLGQCLNTYNTSVDHLPGWQRS